ncbi:MAG: DHH family phosphoesterase [Bacillota bacterium]
MDSKTFLKRLLPQARIYLLIILFLVLVTAFLDWRVAIPCLLLFALLIWYNARTRNRLAAEITGFIEKLELNIDAASRNTLLDFPMPLAIVEKDGFISWHNASFKDFMDKEEIFKSTVKPLILDLIKNGLTAENKEDGYPAVSRQAEIDGMHYNVLCRPAGTDLGKENGNNVFVFYFIDITELVNLKKVYAEEKSAVGIFVIDNYDELMQSMEDSSRPQMLAEIDKKIVQWLSFANGIFKKYERDKYIFLFEQKYLKEFEEKKFDILDSIKEINIGNKIPVTLSLGFGLNGNTLSENYRYAAASIDLALGRGGDQAVIKSGNSFSFFGGKTRELEKRTKVKARVIAFALRELVDQASAVFIMGHENADIDTVGASLGLYRIAKNRGKDAYIILNKVNPTMEGLLQRIQRDDEYKRIFVNRNEAVEMADEKALLIVVDTHRRSFVEIPELIDIVGQVVVIDHHRRGVDYIHDTVLTYQEAYASSTCELVTEIIQYIDEKLELSQVEADALYAGIVVDTKNFTYKTGVRTFEAASYLRRQGADTVVVKQLFQNSLETYSNISAVIKNAELINGETAIAVCPHGMKNARLIAAKASDELLNISGITAAFVLCEAGNEIWISGRSLGDINVQVILEKLGGGGHMTVAGAQLPDIGLEDAKDKLKYAIIEYTKEINRAGV